jgi:tetratricopeptide (TPR) repeat protein
VQYLEHRRSDETPTYPHSFAFGTLAGVGIVGSILFLAFLALALRAVVSAARRAGVATTGLVVASATGFGMFFIHGLADWLWQFPALGALAFALLGLAMRTRSDGVRAVPITNPAAERKLVMPPDDRPRWRAVAARGALAAAALSAAVSLALPGIAARLTESAYHVSATDPTLAIHRLSRAEDLNFLRADASVAEGYIAQAIGQDASARSDFHRALSREPVNWTTYLLLGMLDANDGLHATALRDLAAAHSLNPRQPVVVEVHRQVSSGRRVDVGAVVARLASQLSVRLKPTG